MSGLVQRHLRQAHFGVAALDGGDRQRRRGGQTDLLKRADREKSTFALGAAHRTAGRFDLRFARSRILLLRSFRGSAQCRIRRSGRRGSVRRGGERDGVLLLGRLAAAAGIPRRGVGRSSHARHERLQVSVELGIGRHWLDEAAVVLLAATRLDVSATSDTGVGLRQGCRVREVTVRQRERRVVMTVVVSRRQSRETGVLDSRQIGFSHRQQGLDGPQ